MPYQTTPRAIRGCAGVGFFLIFALLLYSGVFAEMILTLGSVGYEFLRALNSE